MRYQFINGNETQIVEIVQESEKMLTLRRINEDGSVTQFRKKKPVNLIPITESKPNVQFNYWITQPYQHQIDFLNYATTHDCFLLRDKPGLGKTKQSLDLIMNRKRVGQIERALIVCCIGGLQYNWLREVKKHTDLKGYILGTRPISKHSTATKIGSNADKLFDLKNSKADILICNVEMLRRPEIVSQLQLMIGRREIGQIVVDEVHKCKNPKAAQTAGLFSLHPPYKLGLSGTPLVNSPMDIYGISVWMGHERRSLSRYKADYCVMGGFKNKEIIAYQNLGQLGKLLDSWSLMRTKEECLDLPPKTIKDTIIELTEPQKRLYREILRDIRDRQEDILALPSPMGRFVGLRKATSCPEVVLEGFNSEDCAKAMELLRLIEEALANGQKVVVFTWFVFTLKFLNKFLQERGIFPALIYGEMSQEERNQNEQAFQYNPDCKVIIGNYQTMGTGIELYAASLVVEYEQPWTAADEEQAQDRCHRIGQTQNLTIVRLMSKDTVDERVNDIVMTKSNMVDEVNGKAVLAKVISQILSTNI